MFLKGSNWIPADSFKENITPAYLNWLLRSAKEANMNVLRVWGGGVYESDEFYRLANQMGIMIWQDFMFACATYPTDQEFLENVQKEIVYQIKRLRHHPSIIIWSGNNENEAAVSTNWYNTDTNKQLYSDDYRKLYIQTIMPLVQSIDPEMSRPFLSSSPTNGLQTIQENWLAKNPYDLKFGDLHFYDYKMNGWNAHEFPLARFMSEFGVQSLPSYSTLENSYTLFQDFDLQSDLNEHRQHHANGNQQIINEILNNLKMPFFKDKLKNFKVQIYLSQINQAMHLKTCTELYRRSRNYFDYESGQGLSMGTMYWQFNDIWQAPTWSSIEYGGKWKMAHYFIRNSYSPLILSPVLNKTNLDIYAVSDLSIKVLGEFILEVYSYESLQARLSQRFKFEIEEFTSKPGVSIDLNDLSKQTDCWLNLNKSCLIILKSEDSLFENKDFINFLFFKNRLADVDNLQMPNLTYEYVKQTDKKGVFEIQIKADAICLFVWLDLETNEFVGFFSDNGFHLTSRQRIIYFTTENLQVTEDHLKKYLKVRSLFDSYL